MRTGDIEMSQKVVVRVVEIPGCPHLPAIITRIVSNDARHVVRIELELKQAELDFYGLMNPWVVEYPEIGDQPLGGRVVIL